jgi:exodeoxyribonuclease V alpha subunit
VSASTLDELALAGVVGPLDRHFALALSSLVESSEELVLGAAFASRAVQHGHVCADLRRLVDTPLLDRDEQPLETTRLPRLEPWLAALRQSAAVSDGGDERPLVLDGAGRLYLKRYYDYERLLARRIRERAAQVDAIDAKSLRLGLARLFRDSDPGEARQRLATLIAVQRRFTLISGGPGTGKTHTVVKILALLVEQAQTLGRELRVLLLAPTGKAAQRLAESVGASVDRLADTELARLIPRTASTVHRALGFMPRTPTRFRHDAENPLPADVVLVDEASMVDLALMAKLVDAVPAAARLILMGDKDQLASVEAGAILGDIYSEAEPAYSSRFAELVRSLTGDDLPISGSHREPGLQDCLVHLTHSFRYAEQSGIAALARAVNAGDADRALAVLRGEAPPPSLESEPPSPSTMPQSAEPVQAPAKGRVKPPAKNQLAFDFTRTLAAPKPSRSVAADTKRRSLDHDVRLIETSSPAALAAALGPVIEAGFGEYAKATKPAHKLALLARFRVLSAHRRGPFGVDALNQLVEARLVERGLLRCDREWYEGRPLLVTRNDYQLDLYNGDVGVVTTDEIDGVLKAWFLSHDGSLRSFMPARLPPHETVFATTVHKSQGSELDRVALVLPDRPSPIATRELLYTAVTRARRHVDIFASIPVLRAAIAHRIERASGLRDALWSTV